MIALVIILIGLMAFAVTWGTSLIKRPEPVPKPITASKPKYVEVPLSDSIAHMREVFDLPAKKIRLYIAGIYVGTSNHTTESVAYMALTNYLIKQGISNKDIMLVRYFTPMFDSREHFLASYSYALPKDWETKAYALLPTFVEKAKEVLG